MATVDQSLERILDAVRRLPEGERTQLLQEIDALPRPAAASSAARSLRPRFRLGAKARSRMSSLLKKGNAGTLTREEKKELDQLVEHFEKKTLALAQALAEAAQPQVRRKNGADEC